jgi:hypothetical protein
MPYYCKLHAVLSETELFLYRRGIPYWLYIKKIKEITYVQEGQKKNYTKASNHTPFGIAS